MKKIKSAKISRLLDAMKRLEQKLDAFTDLDKTTLLKLERHEARSGNQSDSIKALTGAIESTLFLLGEVHNRNFGVWLTQNPEIQNPEIMRLQ